MLKLADYRSSAKGLPDLLPYAALVAPGVVLNKDGSFLAAWSISGQDTAGSTSGRTGVGFPPGQQRRPDVGHRLDAAC